MNPVDNFFTDLLNKMLSMNAYRLLLGADRKPSLLIRDTLVPAPGYEALSSEEIIYDLEALGIEIKDSGRGVLFYTHVNDAGTPFYFSIEYVYVNNRLTIEVVKE